MEMNMGTGNGPGNGKVAAIDAPTPGTLHVIFHGLFCFFERPNDILVRIPNIPQMHGNGSHRNVPEHVYLAGNWLGETAITPGQYKLMGVAPQPKTLFPRDQNLILDGALPAPDPADLFAELVFDYPDKISSIQRVAVAPGTDIKGDKSSLALIANTKQIATLQVFTYHFLSHLDLKLAGLPDSGTMDHPWSADTTLANGSCSLHLFAEPDHPMQDHVVHAFPIAMKMFQSVHLTLPADLQVPAVTAAELPPLSRIEEMDDLSRRLKRLARLGRMTRANEDLSHFWDNSAGLNLSDLRRCGGAVGNGGN